ncbi:MAG: 2-hydroxyhepta-2,4-diene,7-dioate isomerase [Symbiobacteriaceae bacterium]|jgi:2-keto-4-pentenoate hydratase/2-oxohepta-3-ene-1,7-dioic acid hydratase in catechol pathway|nr:2-hydroxyhepta-2,4-diene,7-dioate isomerase [Symbiobacteriaceae bacterium]
MQETDVRASEEKPTHMGRGKSSMQLITYQGPQSPRVGLMTAAGIVDLGYTDMVQFLSEPDWRERAQAARSMAPQLSGARLLAPVTRPGKLIGIGLNYSDHAAESGMAVPTQPILFAKFTNAITGPYDPILHPGPQLTSKLDWEVELGVVMGRKCRRVSREDALSYVAGYTVVNDVSARDLQMFDGHWLKGKTCDTFAPMGPVLVTSDEIPDPQNLPLTLHVNGEQMQAGNTARMIFSVAEIISFLSHLMTLEPGDLIMTGTPPGVGMGRRPQVWLGVGDVIRCEIPGIGFIENRVELD